MTRRSLTRLQRIRVFDDADGICHLCGCKIHSSQDWQADHIIPLGLDGPDTPDNMRPAHVDCHKAKSSVDKGQIAKAVRQRANHLGIKRRQSRPMPGTKASGVRKRMDGTVERRENDR